MALALYYGKENGYEERDAILAHCGNSTTEPIPCSAVSG